MVAHYLCHSHSRTPRGAFFGVDRWAHAVVRVFLPPYRRDERLHHLGGMGSNVSCWPQDSLRYGLDALCVLLKPHPHVLGHAVVVEFSLVCISQDAIGLVTARHDDKALFPCQVEGIPSCLLFCLSNVCQPQLAGIGYAHAFLRKNLCFAKSLLLRNGVGHSECAHQKEDDQRADSIHFTRLKQFGCKVSKKTCKTRNKSLFFNHLWQ